MTGLPSMSTSRSSASFTEKVTSMIGARFPVSKLASLASLISSLLGGETTGDTTTSRATSEFDAHTRTMATSGTSKTYSCMRPSPAWRVIPKSGYRFSEEITRKQEAWRDPEKWVPVFGRDHAHKKLGVIPKSGYRFSEEI